MSHTSAFRTLSVAAGSVRLRHGHQAGNQARGAGGAAGCQSPRPPTDRTHAPHPRSSPGRYARRSGVLGGATSGGVTATVYNSNTSNGGGPIGKVSVAAGETMPKFNSPVLAPGSEQRTSFASASLAVGTPVNATYSRNITVANDVRVPMTPLMTASSNITKAIMSLFGEGR